MTETRTRTASKFAFERNKRFYLLVTGLIVLTVAPMFVYYELSYNSVNGSTVQVISVQRTVSRNLSGSISSVTYYVETHVWSWAGSIDTQVTNPIFSLTVDSHFISSEEGTSGTFKPYSYLSYSLTFTTLGSVVANKVGQANSSYVTLGMNAAMSAGIFHGQKGTSDGATWTFS